jgi:hypothetical protein
VAYQSDTAPAGEPSARFIPQSLGLIADVAGVSALIIGGGTSVVFATTLGAVLAGAYIVWKRWRKSIDVAVVIGFVIAVAGAGVFGYALAELRAGPARPPTALPVQPDLRKNGANNAQPEQLNPDLSVTGDKPSNSTALSSAPEASWLADMTAVDGGGNWEHGARTVNAKRYERSVVGSTCSGNFGTDDHEAFNIGRQFGRFQATNGIADDAPTDAATRFTVIVDNKEIFRRDLRLGEQAEVDVPVANGLRLVLRVERIGLTECNSAAVWGDAALRR